MNFKELMKNNATLFDKVYRNEKNENTRGIEHISLSDFVLKKEIIDNFLICPYECMGGIEDNPEPPKEYTDELLKSEVKNFSLHYVRLGGCPFEKEYDNENIYLQLVFQYNGSNPIILEMLEVRKNWLNNQYK